MVKNFKVSVVNGSSSALVDMLEKLIRDDEQFHGDAKQKEAIEIVKNELKHRLVSWN